MAATLRLARARALELDLPIAHYLGPLVRHDRGATIRQSLAHTGGWPNPIPISWVHLATEQASFDARAWQLELLRRHGVGGRPGRKARYSNIGYLLVGRVVEEVTGQTPQAVVEREVFARLCLGQDERLGFSAPDLARHARGKVVTLSLLNAVLGGFIDRKRFIAGRHGRWSQFVPFYVNGASYGGLIANAVGLARFAMALLSAHDEVLAAPDRAVFLGTSPGAGALGWFQGPELVKI